MGGAATGDKSGRDSVDGTVKTGGGASGHDVQNTYKNTASILLEAVLCVRLTAYYVISFLFPFVKRRYGELFKQRLKPSEVPNNTENRKYLEEVLKRGFDTILLGYGNTFLTN
ncbi:hypothetical protein D3Z50_21835, partial [Clostridiaceae bacterium]|nr:hypothetical protein [Clostridiaceae bacterium]